MAEGRGPSREVELRKATHDLRNVLAIIRESAGLIEDLVKAEEEGAPPRRGRMAALAGRIGAHADRGADAVSRIRELTLGPEAGRGAAPDL